MLFFVNRKKKNKKKKEKVILDIQKHRNGPTGEINLMFRAERVKFYSVEKRRARQEPVAPVVETP